MARPIRGIANNAASAVSSGIAYAHVAHVSMSARLRFGIASARFHARSWCGAPATTSPRRFADAIEVVIAQTTQGRGILGVVDRQSARASRRPPTSRSASAPARARLQALRTHRARRRYSATKRPTDLAIGPFPTQTTATCRKTRKPTDLAKPPETPANGLDSNTTTAQLKIVVSPVRVRVSPCAAPGTSASLANSAHRILELTLLDAGLELGHSRLWM